MTTAPSTPPVAPIDNRRSAAGCAWWWWVIILLVIIIAIWMAWGFWQPGGSQPNIPGPGPTTPPSPVTPP